MSKKDNSTFHQKLAYRKRLLAETPEPVVMETNGGHGVLFNRCYWHIDRGVVFEKDTKKAEGLARQRQTWTVYNGDCEKYLAAGAGAHLPVNLLDVDPYGHPWPILTAFFDSEREFCPRLGVVVTDGLRQRFEARQGWVTSHVDVYVRRYGEEYVRLNYLDVCQDLLQKKVSHRGYRVTHFLGGYYGNMTLYSAILVSDAG